MYSLNQQITHSLNLFRFTAMQKLFTSIVFSLLFLFSSTITAQNSPEPDSLKNISLSGLSFRSIGPAITGGRTIDIAVNPFNHSEYFIASGHG